ncbi:hypothetical protein [uncultured Mailhella sp.]|nr:hypothetical protein [uncultured Mailhella sp.]
MSHDSIGHSAALRKKQMERTAGVVRQALAAEDDGIRGKGGGNGCFQEEG